MHPGCQRVGRSRRGAAVLQVQRAAAAAGNGAGREAEHNGRPHRQPAHTARARDSVSHQGGRERERERERERAKERERERASEQPQRETIRRMLLVTAAGLGPTATDHQVPCGTRARTHRLAWKTRSRCSACSWWSLRSESKCFRRQEGAAARAAVRCATTTSFRLDFVSSAQASDCSIDIDTDIDILAARAQQRLS